MAQIRSKPFGVTRQGANVTEYILSNPGGLTVSVLDYGCIIKNIIVPAKNGPVDVVLGHDTMADYEDDFTSSGSTCCGAFVGRYANRIENAVFTLGGKTYREGDFISIDGSTGNIFEGVIPTVDAEIAGEFGRIMALADKYRTMKVRTNADTPTDAKKAKNFAEADRIRDQLKAMGVEIIDTPQGAKWRKV